MGRIEFKFQFENPYDVLAEWICYLRTLNENLFSKPDLRKTLQLPDGLDEEVDCLFQKIGRASCRERV